MKSDKGMSKDLTPVTCVTCKDAKQTIETLAKIETLNLEIVEVKIMVKGWAKIE